MSMIQSLKLKQQTQKVNQKIKEQTKAKFESVEMKEEKLQKSAEKKLSEKAVDHESQIGSYTSQPKFQRYMSNMTLQRNVSIGTNKSPFLQIPQRANPSGNVLKSKRSPLIAVNSFDGLMPDFNVQRGKSYTMQNPGNLKRPLQ